MSTSSTVEYLRSLGAVRERSNEVFNLIVEGKADHWDWHEGKLATVVDFCAGLLSRDFGTDFDKIPPHCRRNHFTTSSNGTIDRVAALKSDPLFPTSPVEQARTLIDLYIVSVLLDAGAGNTWTYREVIDGVEVWRGGRSEGLAVASFHMFCGGAFSSDPNEPLRVDSTALKGLTAAKLAKHMQVTDTNLMSGLDGRANLLIQLGAALDARRDIVRDGRPGDILYFLRPQLKSGNVLPLTLFWDTLFALLAPIWPARTTLSSAPGEVLGDVWPCPSLARSCATRKEGDDLVPFHKLTQWLCYSLLEPIESSAGWHVDRGVGQTGLPEYRNGGLLVDHGLLTVRDLPDSAYPNGRDAPPVLSPSDPAVVEWRAATVAALDKIHEGICAKLSVTTQQLQLAQVLEASTWKGGREIAKAKRPATGGPPIEIISDGTVF
ncbi:hypothetical protein CspHIS471_0507360 [Cutaneotrichosporon sp. HIS471]|nr:hypothetical protein CspHIS471_0507360 [Cutaneotrichosporon sp. HIS471]